MKKKSPFRKLIYIIPITLILALVGYRLYIDLNKAEPQKKTRKKTKRKFKIKTVSPIKKEYIETLTYFGNIEEIAKVDLYAKEEARIEFINVDVSDWVNRGKLIAELDDSHLREIKKQKDAALSVAAANLKQDRIKLQQKQLIFYRTRRAFKDKIIIIQELDDSKSEYDIAQAQVRLSQAKLREAQALVDEVEARLKDYKIYSPINGVIAIRYLDSGSLAKLSQPIVKILDISRVKLIVNVPEQEIKKLLDSKSRVKKDIKVNIFVEALKQNFKGRIYSIHPTMDTNTRTIKVEIRLNNRKRQLKPGFYCTAQFSFGEKTEALFLPIKAVNFDEVQKKHWVQLSVNGKVALKEIQINPYSSQEVIITGLDEKDKVISPYNAKLRDGEIIPSKKKPSDKKLS